METRKLLGLIDISQFSVQWEPGSQSKAQSDKQATMEVYIYHTHADRQTESTCVCMQTEIPKVKTKCGNITDLEKQDYKIL